MIAAWEGQVGVFALASIRVGALLLSAPLWGHAAFPVRMRMAFAFLVTLALFPLMGPSSLPSDPEPLLYARAAWSEAWIGFGLGFGTRLAFAGFGLLGEIVSVQGGLGAASVLDPASGTSSVALASLFQTVGLLVFLAMDGPQLLLGSLAATFAQWPVGAALSVQAIAIGLVEGATLLFALAARVAAPLIVTMWIVNIGVGILGRFVPQLNLMMLQLPANILITLVLLGFMAQLNVGAFASAIEEALRNAAAPLAGGV